MSMSTHVVGFKPPDDKWKKMKAIWDSCEEAGIEPPKAVSKFFEDTPPDESGVEIELEEHDCVSEYNDDSCNGFEIDVKKLPPDVTVIRFYNSY
jgi:hypothetical protein